jgi:hypothetical protein
MPSDRRSRGCCLFRFGATTTAVPLLSHNPDSHPSSAGTITCADNVAEATGIGRAFGSRCRRRDHRRACSSRRLRFRRVLTTAACARWPPSSASATRRFAQSCAPRSHRRPGWACCRRNAPLATEDAVTSAAEEADHSPSSRRLKPRPGHAPSPPARAWRTRIPAPDPRRARARWPPARPSQCPRP